jgi:hypothetical protein
LASYRQVIVPDRVLERSDEGAMLLAISVCNPWKERYETLAPWRLSDGL